MELGIKSLQSGDKVADTVMVTIIIKRQSKVKFISGNRTGGRFW